MFKAAEQADNLLNTPQTYNINNEIIIDTGLLSNRLNALVEIKINEIRQYSLQQNNSYESVTSKIYNWFHSLISNKNNKPNFVTELQEIIINIHNNLKNNNYLYKIGNIENNHKGLYRIFNDIDTFKQSPVLSLKYLSINKILSIQIYKLEILHDTKDFKQIDKLIQTLNLNDDLRELFIYEVDSLLNSDISRHKDVELIKIDES